MELTLVFLSLINNTSTNSLEGAQSLLIYLGGMETLQEEK